MTGFVLLLGAAALLTVGAEMFAGHAAAAGRRLGVTALAIGLVLAGAEPEELVTAVFAAAQRHPGIAAGDAIGANITMLTLVLGLVAVIRPMRFAGRVRFYAVVAAVAGAAAAVAVLGGRVGRPAGAGLVLLYGAAVVLIWRRERQPPAFGEVAELLEEEEAERGEGEPADPVAGPEHGRGRDTRAMLLVLAGIAAMAVGGRLAVAGATQITGALGMRDSVVGLTFVALATTAELFALVWSSFRRGVEELALAGVLGSVTYNATVTLGVAALVRPLDLAGTGIAAAAWFAAGLPLLLVAWALTSAWPPGRGQLGRGQGSREGRAGGGLGRVAGIVLLASYAGYLALTFR